MLSNKPPQTGKRQRIHQIAKVEISLAITFACKSQHSVRACFNAAMNQTREMHTQKWKLRVGNWINQMPYQVLPRRLDFVIFPSERHDAHFAFLSRHFTHAIAMQSSAID